MKSYLPIGVPIVCSLVSFILAFLVLFAGKNPGFMEDYHIIMLNTSELGKNLVPTPTADGASKPSSTDGGCGLPGVFGKICGSATSEAASAVSHAADTLGDIENDIADKLAEKLGLHEFYSLHAMNTCEGDFSPNATSKDAKFNVTSCSKPLDSDGYNVTALFDVQLSVGPLDLSLADIGFTKKLQKQFDNVAKLFLALGIIYIFAVGSTGLSFVASVAALALIPRQARRATMVNLGVASLAVLVLLVGNLVTTIGARTAANKIDDVGEDIGLRASAGVKFMAMAWAAFGLMVITACYWGWQFSQNRRNGRGGVNEKYDNRRSVESYVQPQYSPRY